MSPPSSLPSAFPLRSHRTAMLVIHGIGEQNPYETLDSFARGLFSYLRDRAHLNPALAPLTVALEGLDTSRHSDHRESRPRAHLEGRLDLFEYYWAPDTEDKLSWKDTLKWLIQTDLTPIRYFADNLQEMMSARGQSFGSAFGYSLKLCAREILRVLLLYIPLAAARFGCSPGSPIRAMSGLPSNRLAPHSASTPSGPSPLFSYFMPPPFSWSGSCSNLFPPI